jgi:hypothetical protein
MISKFKISLIKDGSLVSEKLEYTYSWSLSTKTIHAMHRNAHEL